jgi:2-polyprenyl-6-methoxyphenol hydroxylase-like FAD-dependent oxidoreductase
MSIYDTPDGKRLGLIARIEGNRYIVTLAGKLGVEMPHDDESFIAFAGKLSQPHLYNAITQMTPISDIVKHRTPSSLRRHYEKINMPDGLVVMGDALCSFNPIFGQGMTVAALEAVQLGNLVGEHRNNHKTMAGFSNTFQKAAAKALRPAWLAATSEDMRHPEIGVDVPLMTRLTNWYMKNLHDVCAYDKEVHLAFSRAMQMTEPIYSVFAPSIVVKVLRESIHSRETPVNNTARSTQQVAAV